MPQTFTLTELTAKAQKVTLMAERLQEAKRRLSTDMPYALELSICPTCFNVYHGPTFFCACVKEEKPL
jgi:hypothetical protein